MSVVAVYVPPEMCETEEMFYTKLNSVLDQCPCHYALIVLGDFKAVTGTERADYELCVGSHDWYIPGTTTALSFWILQDLKGYKMQVFGIKDQHYTADLVIAKLEG